MLWALAFVLLIAGFGLLLIEWGKRAAARAFWDLVEAFEVDVAADLEDPLEDPD